jgi:hypothetical protein
VGAITASFMMMWLVQKYGKIIVSIRKSKHILLVTFEVVYPFATLAFAAAFVVFFFLHETTGLQFLETIEEAERTIHQVEMQPLAQKEIIGTDDEKNTTCKNEGKS